MKTTLQIVSSAPKNLSIKDWSALIKSNISMGVSQWIDAGLHIEAAVSDFRSQDSNHWKHAYSELLRQVGISRSTAHRLREIAANAALRDSTIHNTLPTSWGTLAVLARLDPAEIKRRVKAQEITPETTRAQVAKWLPSNRAHVHGSIKPKPDPIDHAHDILVRLPVDDFVREILNIIHDHPQATVDMIAQAEVS